MSTSEFQDVVTSRAWQRSVSEELVEGFGGIVVEYERAFYGDQFRQVVARLNAAGVQARVQGRFLGGRPPYGYRLVDAGPHPNPVHARWGRRRMCWSRTQRVVGAWRRWCVS